MSTVHDVFIYGGESEMLRLRMEILSAARAVHHAIVGKNYWDGSPADFEKPPCQWIEIDNSGASHIYDAETQVRNGAIEYKFHEGDVVMFGDVDEIPDPSRLAEFNVSKGIASLECHTFRYKMYNLVFPHWPHFKICTAETWNSCCPSTLRETGVSIPAEIQYILRAGWHFSHMYGTEAKLLEALKRRVHRDEPCERSLIDALEVKAVSIEELASGKCAMGLPRDESVAPLPLPKCVMQNINHYRSIGWI